VTPDAEPVVIGGLIGNTKSSSESKVPLLGDIPLLGQLFRSSSKSDQKNELLIFLTPHVVREPNQLTALSEHETSNAQIITNSINEQELNRYLDRVPVKPPGK
ncbi:MAG TPA: type II secretion system protein GspD, partial [Candidatus Binatia bacterium]|nr:type II secretion system protein GspD [Candidatus Binatia bacterium]